MRRGSMVPNGVRLPRMSKNLLRVSTALLVISVAACGGAAEDGATASTPAASPASASSSGYPAAYRSLNLPEIDGGTVTGTGRDVTSLADGITVRVMSEKPLDDVRAYYTKTMTEAGWTMTPPGRGGLLPNMPVAMLEFTKDRLTYQVTLTAQPGGTQIGLIVTER